MQRISYEFLGKKDVCRILGNASRATLERDVAEGRFPKPYKLGKRRIGWKSSEVQEYLENLPRMEDAYSRRLEEIGGYDHV